MKKKFPVLRFLYVDEKDESEHLFLKETKKIAIGKLEDGTTDEKNQGTVSAAKILRKVALNTKRWTFERNLDADIEQIPELLTAFF